MREQLKERVGKRGTFTATFKRFGTKTAYKGPPLKTALFVDVKNTLGETVADHVWFTVLKTWDAVNLEPGDQVRFKATPEPYKKGYRGRREDWDLPAATIDYCLKRPSDVRKTGRNLECGLHVKETVLNVTEGQTIEIEETEVQDLDLDELNQGTLF